MTYGNAGDPTMTLDTNNITGALIGTSAATCSATPFDTYNYVYRADVKARVTANGKYVLSTVFLHDGAITVRSGQSAAGLFPNVTVPLALDKAWFRLGVGDGQSSGLDGLLRFNTQSVPGSTTASTTASASRMPTRQTATRIRWVWRATTASTTRTRTSKTSIATTSATHATSASTTPTRVKPTATQTAAATLATTALTSPTPRRPTPTSTVSETRANPPAAAEHSAPMIMAGAAPPGSTPLVSATMDIDLAKVLKSSVPFEPSPVESPRAATSAPASGKEHPPSELPAPPRGKRWKRFDPQTGRPLPEPVLEDIPSAPLASPYRTTGALLEEKKTAGYTETMDLDPALLAAVLKKPVEPFRR